MHELPQLGKLEKRYGDELAVIGVQSPKYPAEGDPDNLRHAVDRYGVRHPVVNDPDYRVWESYAVSAWPTLVFISPDGEVIGRHAGEVPFEALSQVMDELIAEYEKKGSLSRVPIPQRPSVPPHPDDQLWFPGKVLATEIGLFIADSSHHRIILTDLGGAVQRVIGTGEPGLQDGHVSTARFNRPQGMALDPDGRLYVADSDNHVIRAVDLETLQVRTIAGTGEQARRVIRAGAALQTPLSSPWDLALSGRHLFIAMAGLHQVWMLDMPGGSVEVWAGTGHEGLRDGPRREAWLAQPMGLSLDEGSLFVSCAEAQAVRRIDTESGEVSTLVGAGLFEYGDEDGPSDRARLQHNQDVAVASGTVYVADTYNNKIRVLDRASREVSTYLGSGTRGLLDGPGHGARLDEPAGLSLYDGMLYIADTNNHAVRRVDLETGHIRTLNIQGTASPDG